MEVLESIILAGKLVWAGLAVCAVIRILTWEGGNDHDGENTKD